MQNNAEFKINIAGNIFNVVGKLQGDFKQIVNVVDKVDNSVNNTFNNLQKKINTITLNAIIDQVKHVSSAVADLTRSGIGFEQEMAELSAITGIAGRDLNNLGKAARKVGKDSGLGAAQAAKAFSLLASQLDVDNVGIEGLKELQKNVITLSHASGISMEESANALAQTINQYGFSASEASRVINVLAAGSKHGAAEIADLSQSFKVVGSQSSIAGVSIEETAGALEILARNGVRGSEAGTDLRNIILSLQTVFGVDLTKTSLSDALDQIKPKLEDAGFMSKNFGRLSMASAQYLVKYSDDIKEMTANVTDTNTAQEQATIRTATTQQMMERCRATIDNLKIGYFNLTGSTGGYMTVIAEQSVILAQLIPLVSLMIKGVKFLTNAEKMQAMWTGIVTVATGGWSKAMAVLNATVLANPLVWIVGLIIGLVAAIIWCMKNVQGWGEQWKAITDFMKACFQLFAATIKLEFTTVINTLMMGLDYIKKGWYKFRNAVGLGNKNENLAMISQIDAQIDERKQKIIDGAKRVADLAKTVNKGVEWKLSMKEKKDDSPQSFLPGVPSGVSSNAPSEGTKIELAGKGGGRGDGGKTGSVRLDNIVPDFKGSGVYSAIASKLNPVKIAAIAAASMVMPMTAAATSLSSAEQMASTEYKKGSVTMAKFCDKIEIHIASADGKGYDQVRREMVDVIDKMLDDYGA